MVEMLREVGRIAGIGGLALGIFLLLFRRIQLPKATRKHLTLFMWLVWSICVLGILVFITGEILSRHRPKEAHNREIQTYSEIIYSTLPDDDFLAFLESNIGKTIRVSSYFDMSMNTDENREREELFGIDEFREDPSTELPLLAGKVGMTGSYFKLLLLNNRKLPLSSGGTGIVQFPLIGYFNVTKTFTGGPLYMFYLTEVPATVSTTSGL